MKRILSVMISIVLVYMSLDAKIFIFTHSYNRTDFIEIQYRTLQKFFKDDYEFVVFNDGKDKAMTTAIDTTCARLGIRCIRIPQQIHTYAYLHRWPGESFNNACVRCANVVQYSLNEVGLKHDDLVMIIDSDMFLVKEFSMREYMKDCDLAGVPQSRENNIEYLWNGLVFFDMRTLPNKNTIDFNCGRVNNVPVDVGGQMYYYLQNNPEVRVKRLGILYLMPHLRSEEVLKSHNFDEKAIKFILSNPSNIEYVLDNSFLHYRGGTNWDNQSRSYHDEKTRLLNNYIADLLN